MQRFLQQTHKNHLQKLFYKRKNNYSRGQLQWRKEKSSTKARWIDLKGGFLMPGFIDSHNHGIYGGRVLTKVNFNKYVSGVDELLASAKEK